MRWIFIVLLGANILLFAWNMLSGSPAPSQASAPQRTSAAPTVVLLEEADEGASPSAARTPDQAENSSDASSPARGNPQGGQRSPLCTFLGPFSARDDAEQLVERLAAMDVPGEVAEVEVPAGPGYWVYVEPLESRREALRYLSELQSRGIDSYIIPKGDLVNGISLGMFSREALARARLKELAEQEIDAKLEVIERSYQEIWVSVPERYARRLGDEGWKRLLNDYKSINRKQNLCLRVASQDNIH